MIIYIFCEVLPNLQRGTMSKCTRCIGKEALFGDEHGNVMYCHRTEYCTGFYPIFIEVSIRFDLIWFFPPFFLQVEEYKDSLKTKVKLCTYYFCQ